MDAYRYYKKSVDYLRHSISECNIIGIKEAILNGVDIQKLDKKVLENIPADKKLVIAQAIKEALSLKSGQAEKITRKNKDMGLSM
jgi:hypothetical protein